MKYQFVSIEGNIGAGKTTLATKLADHYQGKLLLESFSDNPFLSSFYNDADRNALPLELHFLIDRLNQFKNIDFKASAPVISDYMFVKSKIYAGVTLNDDEFGLYQKIFDLITPDVPKPELLIYLHSPINKLKNNIKKRGRSYEQNISSDYLEKIQNAYQPYLKQYQRVLLVEMNQADFENPDHFKQLTDFLEKDYDFTNYTLTIQ